MKRDDPFSTLERAPFGCISLPRLRPTTFISGWLDLAADVIGTSRGELLDWVSGGNWPPDPVDLDRDPEFVLRLVRSRAMVPEHWTAVRPLVERGRLMFDKRLSYCPICFAEDLHRRRLPHFRAEWTWAWLTHCRVHQTPLFRWDITRNHRSGERRLPPTWIAVSMGTRACGLTATETDQLQRLRAPLHIARKARAWSSDNEPYAWFWRQQVAFERALFDVVRGGGAGDLLGAFEGRRKLLCAVQDMSVLFCGNFERAAREPWAATWKTYLGPDALFGGFSTLAPYRGTAALDPLADLDDPRGRRTTIALIGRVLHGFRLDLFSSSRRAPSEPGFNASTSDLKNIPDAAKQWCATRWDGWPEVVRRGFQVSL